MPNDTRRSPDRPSKRSRLFQARPDRLLVEEWVPSIALPAPPQTPLEEIPGEPRVDEHGIPELPHEPDDTVRVGPARLYVGQGRRPTTQGEAPGGDEAQAGYFVAELRLPRPEDGLPFGLAAREEDPDPWSEELEFESAEMSDPASSTPDLTGAFTLDLDTTSAPDPPLFFLPPPAGAEPVAAAPEPLRAAPDPGPPSASLSPSPAREPLARRIPGPSRPAAPPVQARPASSVSSAPAARPAPVGPSVPDPERPVPTAVIRSKPSWTRARPLPAPAPAPAPLFQAREEPLPNPWVQRFVSWPTLVVLVAVLVAATALLVRGLLST